MWGERQDTDTNPTASTKQDPINSQPSGPGAFDNNAAMQYVPLQAIDRAPNPWLWRHTNTGNDAKRPGFAVAPSVCHHIVSGREPAAGSTSKF